MGREAGEPMVLGAIRTDTKFPSSVGVICGAQNNCISNIKDS